MPKSKILRVFLTLALLMQMYVSGRILFAVIFGYSSALKSASLTLLVGVWAVCGLLGPIGLALAKPWGFYLESLTILVFGVIFAAYLSVSQSHNHSHFGLNANLTFWFGVAVALSNSWDLVRRGRMRSREIANDRR